MDPDRLAPLNLLLKAKTKVLVVGLFQEAFRYRSRSAYPDAAIDSTAESLGVERAHVVELYKAIALVINTCLYEGFSEPETLAAMFPESFHKNLKELIVKIIVENLDSWRQSVAGSQVSLPRLQDFDWRIDIKSSANSMARMSVPTCIVQMQVQETPRDVETMASRKNVNIEFTKETLETMLDGLGKIRDQLSSVAARQS
ncbi:COMM domain-containing protein 9-like [Corticium candelabrum]|uniref:COMM domain-containing protein 9-like n=1 Tax=Corticium candelabrum TaxID=121492 RepID=UPI002E2632A2|nr:COMM domain-containing protein 9-like [Corticium candelabrum]